MKKITPTPKATQNHVRSSLLESVNFFVALGAISLFVIAVVVVLAAIKVV